MAGRKVNIVGRISVVLCAISSILLCFSWVTSKQRTIRADPPSITPIHPQESTQNLVYQWMHPVCGCPRYFPLETATANYATGGLPKSTCGPAADFRGPLQRVLAFAFYGNVDSVYFKGIARNAKLIASLYEGWAMRLYHDVAPSSKRQTTTLCNIICANPVMDDCYVPDLQDQFEKLASKFQMLWRFLPMADPLVDIFSSRDLDSTIYQREVDAVNEWMGSNKTWHLMRDHKNHAVSMLGGMWGVKISDNRTNSAAILSAILTAAQQGKGYGHDQSLLNQLVFPIALKSLLSHDSFQCRRFKDTTPFPTQRVNWTFVGDKPNLASVDIWTAEDKCPEECRPPLHKDWLYC